MLAAIWAASMGLAQQPFDLDLGFRTNILTSGVSVSQYVNSILPMDDGTLIISGQFRFPGDMSNRSGARLAADGAKLHTISQMGGRITPWNDLYYCGSGQSVVRHNADWAVDPTFDMNSSWPLVSIFQGGDYHVFPDGRVLVTGSHDMYDTLRGFVGPHQLVWFQSNGYLDTTRVHRQCNGILWTLKEQPDGKFLIGSWCSWYDGHAVGPVFRIHPDGALDTTFNVPMQHASYTFTHDMYHYQDGRTLLAGTYTSVPGLTDTVCVVRLHSDGQMDQSFHVASYKDTTTVNRVPRAMGVLPLDDGRIIVVGDFDMVDGYSRRGIVMLQADGTVDDGMFDDAGCAPYYFNQGQYLERTIMGIVPAPDGGYYICGEYLGYSDGTTNDPTQRFVSRLHGLDVGVREHEALRMEVYPNPASTYVTVELQEPLAHGVLVLRDALGREVMQQRVAGYQNTVPLQGLGAGVYVLELQDRGRRVAVQRVVVSVL